MPKLELPRKPMEQSVIEIMLLRTHDDKIKHTSTFRSYSARAISVAFRLCNIEQGGEHPTIGVRYHSLTYLTQ